MLRCLSVLLLLSISVVARAAIDVEVRPNPVLPGEVFELRITQSPAGQEEPRLGVLPDGIRELQRQQSQSMQIINGTSSTSRTWNIALVARAPGQYILRPQPLDNEPIAPLQVEVRAPDPNAPQQAEVFAHFSAGSSETWVGAEVTLHLQIFVAGELDSGSLPDPQVDGLLIEKVRERNDGEELIGNTRYRVLDRRYVVFAERPGEITIPGPVFIGQLVDRNRRSRFPNFSVPTRRVQTVAPDVTLQVRPAEPQAGTAWLPARKVTLEDSLDIPGGTAERGQALTRTIRLRIDGQLHTQIPALNWPLPPREQAQTYEEQGRSETRAQGDGVSSEQVQRFVHVPQGDVLELPAVRLPWFNIQTGRWEEARLDGRSLPVRAARGTPPTPAAATPVQESSASTPASSQNPPASNPDTLRWWQALALASSGGWITTLLAWFWWLRRQPRHPESAAPAAVSRKPAKPDQPLQTLLRTGDPQQVEQALLAWGRAQALIGPGSANPHAQGLHGLAAALGRSDLATAVLQLSAHLYGNAGWTPEPLKAALQAWSQPRPARPARKPSSDLPPLYPDDDPSGKRR